MLVVNLENNTSQQLSGTSSGARILWFTWLSDSRIAFYRQPQAGLDAYSMWAINIDGTRTQELLVPGGWEDGYPTGAGRYGDFRWRMTRGMFLFLTTKEGQS